MSRVDRLTEGARRVAQIAAVAGRTFPVRIVEHVLGKEQVERDLPGLLRAEIVREVRRFPELECRFKHGLLQDAALATVTPEPRRELAGSVARAVEDVFASSVDEQLELLAQLHVQAGELEQAHDCLLRAADRAASFDASAQAAELRRRAEKVAGRLGR